MPSSISSSRPLALLLGLGLFIAAEQWLWSSAVVARRLLAIQPASASADAMGVAARIRLMNADQTPPLILLGSSQIREGLDCDILAGAPGLGPCVNLGIGGGAPLDLLHISRELGDGPRTLVLAIFPGVVSKSPKSGFIDTSTVRALAASGVWSRITPDDWRLLETGLAQTLSPTLRHREALREAYRERGGAWPRLPEGTAVPFTRRTTDADRKPPIYFANRINRVDPDHALSRFTPAQSLALDWLIEREARAGHRIVVVDFPTRPGFETTLGPEVRAHYASLLDRLRARSDIRFVEASELGPLSENEFIDFTHLDSTGRRLVSERLKSLLAR
jgi:hypothetical protein